MSVQQLNCACCPVYCNSVGRYLPKSMPARATYGNATQRSYFNVAFDTVNNQWSNASGDQFLCGNLYLRDIVMKCTATEGEFYLEMTTVAIQQELFGNMQVIRFLNDDNPFYLLAIIEINQGAFGIVGCDGQDLTVEIKEEGFA